jgi:hypothetical protein
MQGVNISGMVNDVFFSLLGLAIFHLSNMKAFADVFEGFALCYGANDPGRFAIGVCMVIALVEVSACHSIYMYHFERNKKP